MHSVNSAVAGPSVREELVRMRAAIVALALGTVILLGVGFAPSEAVHNAAHDTRHVFALPCH